MSVEIVIAVCLLLLLAYAFDLTSQKTKIPSVVLLLFLGWLVQQGTTFFEFGFPDLSPLLPVLGTIGLILIVMEGSLDLELDKSKIPLIKKSLFMAFVPMAIMAVIGAYTMNYYGGYPLKDCFTNMIPLCVISSAIAIPSASNLNASRKEFIVYESSLSDILGVVFFNFLALNEFINWSSIQNFFLQILAMVVISFIATAGLSLLLSRLKHHIKFGPIIILIVLIYEIAKLYHLPSLIFILLFGLFLGNLDVLKDNKYIQFLQPEKLDKEVKQFKEIAVESAFLIRSLFFILFGFLIQTEELLNAETFIWSLGFYIIIYIIRAICLWVIKYEFSPFLILAPRGLITILLFLSVAPEQQVGIITKPLVIQLIILTAVTMMIGLIFNKKIPVAAPSEGVLITPDGTVNTTDQVGNNEDISGDGIEDSDSE